MNNPTDRPDGQTVTLAAESSGAAAAALSSPWLPAELGRNGARQRHRFDELVRQWQEATLLLSSITDMAMHPAYQQIIGIGQEALPLLLEELRRQPDHWFWALQAITGANPVPSQDRGDVARMTQAWLTWAQQHGL